MKSDSDVNRSENVVGAGSQISSLSNVDPNKPAPTGNTVGLDVGLKEYYTDSDGTIVENPR
jgi:putative transposase